MKVFESLIPALASALKASGSQIVGPEKIALDPALFKPLAPKQGPRMLFVDGGNGEILRGASVSVQFVRTYAVLYENNVRVKRDLSESIVVVVARNEEYKVSVLDLEGKETHAFTFSASDPTLSFGSHRAKPSTVAGYVRKVLEVERAARWCADLNEGDMIVRDGNLDEDGKELSRAIKELKARARERSVMLLGLSKTSTLTTETGASAIHALQMIAPKGRWAYYAGGVLSFVKLHPNAKYVFRCDVMPSPHVMRAFEALAVNASDPAFLGYPYGLLDADRGAQVTKHETAQLRARFAVMSKEQFRGLESAVDAHDILDSL